MTDWPRNEDHQLQQQQYIHCSRSTQRVWATVGHMEQSEYVRRYERIQQNSLGCLVIDLQLAHEIET